MHIFPMILDNGMRIQGFPLKGIWMDVGRPRDLLRVNIVTAEKYGSGLGCIEDTSVAGTVYFGMGSEADCCNIIDSVILSKSMLKHSFISNSLIMSSCKICDASIQNSIIGENCVICKGAVIRNSVLEDGTYIESNSVLDEGREI